MKRLITVAMWLALILPGSMQMLQAQTISPWFRGGKEVWETLAKESFSTAALHNAAVQRALLAPLAEKTSVYTVKTTPTNWLIHRIKYPGVFSGMEKNMILGSKNISAASLGRLTYFHDRDALLFQAAGSRTDVSVKEEVFQRHQDILKNTLAELEAFYIPTMRATWFSSSIFSNNDIVQLMRDPLQPPAYVISPKEMEIFATLSLEDQRQFAQKAYGHALEHLNKILSSDPNSLGSIAFDNYYRYKLRLSYFETLQRVLAKASAPRKSLIIRCKRMPGLAFLPHSGWYLTDAERLGYLNFYTDKLQQSTLNFREGEDVSMEQYLALKAELARQTKIYSIYAVAESFSLPYEQVVERGTVQINKFLPNGTELSQRVREPNFPQLIEKSMEELQKKLAALCKKTPTDPAFYAQYFHLTHQLQCYQVLLIQHRLLTPRRKP